MATKYLLENTPEACKMRWHVVALLASQNRVNQEMGLAFVKSGGLFWGHLVAMNQISQVFRYSSIAWPPNLEEMIQQDCPPRIAEFMMGRIASHGRVGYIHGNGIFDHDRLFRTVLDADPNGILDLVWGWKTLKSLNDNPNLFDILMQNIHLFNAEDLLTGHLESPLFHTNAILGLFKHFEGREEKLINAYFKDGKLDLSNTSLNAIPETWKERLSPKQLDLRGTKIRKIPDAWLDTLEAVEANDKTMRGLRGQVLGNPRLKWRWAKDVVLQGLLHEVECGRWEKVKEKLHLLEDHTHFFEKPDWNRYFNAKFRLAVAEEDYPYAWSLLAQASAKILSIEDISGWWNWRFFGQKLILKNLQGISAFVKDLRMQMPAACIHLVLSMDNRFWKTVFATLLDCEKREIWAELINVCYEVLGSDANFCIPWKRLLAVKGTEECTATQQWLFKEYYHAMIMTFQYPINYKSGMTILLDVFQRNEFRKGIEMLIVQFLTEIIASWKSFLATDKSHVVWHRWWHQEIPKAEEFLEKLRLEVQ